MQPVQQVRDLETNGRDMKVGHLYGSLSSPNINYTNFLYTEFNNLAFPKSREMVPSACLDILSIRLAFCKRSCLDVRCCHGSKDELIGEDKQTWELNSIRKILKLTRLNWTPVDVMCKCNKYKNVLLFSFYSSVW